MISCTKCSKKTKDPASFTMDDALIELCSQCASHELINLLAMQYYDARDSIIANMRRRANEDSKSHNSNRG